MKLKNHKSRRRRRLILWSSLLLIVAIVVAWMIYLSLHRPTLPINTEVPIVKVQVIDSNTRTIGASWLHKNRNGFWELYIEGNPSERGAKTGALCQALIEKQEGALIKQIRKIVPSVKYLKFLRIVVGFFNRTLGQDIPEEYKEEIYALSTFLSPSFNYIGTPYQRNMNYHAAHDIGHTLQSMGLVGCTSFALWGEQTQDGLMMVGRNFDFYLGDEFAEDKIVAFVNPDKGYKHMFVTWGGMIGVVSGMNEMGLSVTLNASNTQIPWKSETPVSIIAREMLQYAKNLEEAIEIAGRRRSFVSEQFLVASALDGYAVVIEKTRSGQEVFRSNRDHIISTNHFQTPVYSTGENAAKQREETASGYRYLRVEELLNQQDRFTPSSLAAVLRDTRGHHDEEIGLGNEKAINQLICHHSVIFAPEKKMAWVSTYPYQSGAYLAYNLDSVFNMKTRKADQCLSLPQFTIPADSAFLQNRFTSFQMYREIHEAFVRTGNIKVRDEDYISLNPNFYQTFVDLGVYRLSRGENDLAANYFSTALEKEIPSLKERKSIEKHLKKCRHD